MKSLQIFLFIVIKREEKLQGSLWENERPKATLENEKTRVNETQRWPWKSIYVAFSFLRKVRTSLLILFVERLMRVDYSLHSLQSFECGQSKYFVGLISCCSQPYVDYSLMMWVIWIISDVNMCCELLPSCMLNLG